MAVHELKTDPKVFDDVLSGNKKFEIRFNDRGYKVGDELHLRKTKYTGEQMKDWAPLEYTGNEIAVSVTHVLRGPVYGLEDGWVIMSIERI